MVIHIPTCPFSKEKGLIHQVIHIIHNKGVQKPLGQIPVKTKHSFCEILTKYKKPYKYTAEEICYKKDRKVYNAKGHRPSPHFAGARQTALFCAGLSG
jgi:hypothetical protein